ncbi:MAG: ABC transporter ATP-binding protein [Christensenellales bacterium]|jgi:ATP-binding cassette subfamily B protein
MAKKNDSNKQEQVPLKEAYELTKRAFLILWKRHPKIFISSALSAAVSSLTPYVAIFLSARIIDELAGSRDPLVLRNWIVIALISAAVLALLNAALLRWKNVHHAVRYYQGEKILADKLLDMDFASVDDQRTHDLLSQVRQNLNWGGWGFIRIIRSFESCAKALISILGAAVLSVSLFTQSVPVQAGMLVFLNSPLFVGALIVLMAGVTLLAPTLSNKAESYWVRCAEDARMGNRYFGFFSFMAHDKKRALDIRTYRQDIICDNYASKEGSFSTGSKIANYARGPMGLLQGLSAVVSTAFTGVIYVFVCLKAWAGAFGVGAVTQYVGAITALSKGVSDLISTAGTLRANAEFLRPAFEFLDIPNDMYQGSLTTEKRADCDYQIEFRNVSFKYPGTDDYALKDVSIAFNVGERLAVVGQNGSGKTTFIKLLCRLYDPTDGEILLNGIDIRKYDYDQYLSIFAVVFQDFQLLSLPLGQNVAAALDYDNEKAKATLIEAGFGERLANMPKGLQTCLYKGFEDDGVEISGGEAQKIALARALYKQAPFIILDEPTAALDPIAEYEIYTKFNEFVGEKTAIYISHRLSSCRFCDDIAVFDLGRIVQKGGHDQLLREVGGKYHQLWHAQAQHYE